MDVLVRPVLFLRAFATSKILTKMDTWFRLFRAANEWCLARGTIFNYYHHWPVLF